MTLPGGITNAEHRRHLRRGEGWCTPCRAYHPGRMLRDGGGACRSSAWPREANAVVTLDRTRRPARAWAIDDLVGREVAG